VITSGCGTSIDHAALAVGWGFSSISGNYWIVQNTWGATWGENGYVLIGMNTSAAGMCGINQYVYYPLI
jgi:C1A family cysteine protease